MPRIIDPTPEQAVHVGPKFDEEISAMAYIAHALEPLDVDARRRVVEWAAARWSVRIEVQEG